MLIATKKKYDIQKLKGLLSAEFEMKDLGAARKILGMEIIKDRERRKLFLSQRSCIQKVLARFDMSSSKPIDTPSAANINLIAMFAPQSEEEKEYMSRVPYASAVGSLMYAMAVKRIFRYLRGTSDVGLIYGGDTQCLVTGYSDSDYAGDVDTRRSMTGYVFTLGGSVVSWKTTLQPTVTLSTTEAEYMALTEAAKEGIWLKKLKNGRNPSDYRPDIAHQDDSFIYLVLYVDDMLIAAKKKYDIQKLKGLLSAEFEMKDLGAARKILGMEIIRDRERRKLFLSQRSYIQKVLARFGMSSSKPIDTPSAANIHLTAMFAPQSEEEKEYMSRVPYASAVGSLMYAMVWTRPDLAHAVSVVSKFMGQPGKEHWQAVKRIFRYLRGTSDVGLIYGGDTQCLVSGYSDSDYAGDVDTRRSMNGYVFTLGGSVVSWKATLQPTVTSSTTEAEYMALTEAAKEGIWLKGLASLIVLRSWWIFRTTLVASTMTGTLSLWYGLVFRLSIEFCILHINDHECHGAQMEDFVD
uniref:Reverse transcriptase Ty1/copia-type domain-containing protein n=1 Tax=Solanum lycopersicum TaxID=4081 RepID=A0A3Q7HRQ0_SOLLC